MTRRVIRSITEVEREKFKYLQPYSRGGQAGRTWTSRAPLWYRNSVVSRSWVPRTMESSMSSRLLPLDELVDGDQLHLGDEVALALHGGHEGAGPGGRVLDKGPGEGDAALVGVADGVGRAGIGNTPATVSGWASSRRASMAPQW